MPNERPPIFKKLRRDRPSQKRLARPKIDNMMGSGRLGQGGRVKAGKTHIVPEIGACLQHLSRTIESGGAYRGLRLA